jgi:putative ABC transport system permease protein
MPIPLQYNVLSVHARWRSTLVAVLGIAGTVGIFVFMLAMARGFQATLVASGSPGNALVRRGGSTSEMDSAFDLATVRVVETAEQIVRDDDGPVVSPEIVVIASLPLKKTGTDANVQVRGVSPRAFRVRQQLRIVEGRAFREGLAELCVGRNARNSYAGLGIGETVRFGGSPWTVVGVFDAGGSAFDSEVWADRRVLAQVYKRPADIFGSMTVNLGDAARFESFRKTLQADPRVKVEVEREVEYYAKQSQMLSSLIRTLGFLIAAIMGVGAVFAALNTMYSAVSERSREIATMRAIGFGAGAVVLSFVIESVLISLVGGVVGCVAVLPFNGVTAGTMNWQTFSHLAFAFRITPDLLAQGMVFALLMGVVGGVPPALRAARRPVAEALRGL